MLSEKERLKLFPKKITSVRNIDFEYSSKRGNPDNSAFDVFVEYNGKESKGFIGIEVKYAETLFDNPASPDDKEYERVARKSGIFSDENIAELIKMPQSLEQIWRDHLLALSILQHKDTEFKEGFFINFVSFPDSCANSFTRAATL